jgi:sigma-B regulation protein RsbU (phosphoserine phosphatase)
MPGLRIHVYLNQQLVHSAECPGLVELGRQAEGEGGPYLTRQEGNRHRIVVARLDEVHVPRRYLTVQPLAPGRVRLTNLNPRVSVSIVDGSPLDPGSSRDVPVPVFVVVGDRKLGIQQAEQAPAPLPMAPIAARPALRLLEGDQATPLQTLAEATLPPGARLAAFRAERAGGASLLVPPSEPHNETMIRWLQAAMDVLQSAASSSEFFDKAAASLVDLVGLDLGQVLLLQDGVWRLQAHKSAAREPLGDERQASRHVLSRMLAEKRTFWQVPSTATPQGSLAGVNAVVAAPILDRTGAVIGALYGDRQARGVRAGLAPITRQEALLVELLAGGVAAGVARLEQEQAELQRQKKFLLYEHELQIGRQIQVGFLPETLPQPAGWEVVAHFQPARDVAGDFYDVFPLSGDRVVLVMADVCDKGVGAALFMALFRSLIRAFCMGSPLGAHISVASGEPTQRPAGTVLPASQRRAALMADLIALLGVEHTNRYVTSNHANAFMFATLFLGVLDTATGSLSYVNAGHEPPTIVGPQGVKTRLEPTGPAVGLMPEASFDLGKMQLERGDVLVMHTDGVTDARDPAGQSFTERRFLSLLAASAPAADLIDRLVTAVRSHIASADQFDDITLLAVRWAPEASMAAG